MLHELISVVEAADSLTRKPEEYEVYTFYSEYDLWYFQSMFDERRCELCEMYEASEWWRGDQLRKEFPYHEILDENTIGAYVHPNCRCYLVRYIEPAKK